MSERDETEGVQRRTLLVVLILNAALFVGLGIGGLLADSSALLANALDNASDSAVYLMGTEPIGWTMMGMAVVAAIVNLVCLELIRRQRSEDVNMKAAETFSFNDFASNGGILIAGGLVLWLDQSWPDLVVGLIVAGIAVKGGVDILRDSRAETRAGEEA